MIKIVLALMITTLLLAKHENCEFKNKDYSDICEKVVKAGVSYEYANQFLLSYFKTTKFDEVSWKYLQPKYITIHKANEKKANNALVKYVPMLVQHLKDYKEVYDFSEKKYGVNREIIGAILLKETRIGKIKPTHDAFIVFNTIVVKIKEPQTEREKWLLNMGKTNMASIIHYCYKKGLAPDECNLPSSYAGAVGIPQFMPNSFFYADGYKTEIGDLTKMEDAIMSASRFLHDKANFNQLIEWDKIPVMPTVESDWYDYEFEHKNASFVYDKSTTSNVVYDCFACQKSELQYLNEYTKKVMRYNNSSNYSVGVIRLAYDAHKLL